MCGPNGQRDGIRPRSGFSTVYTSAPHTPEPGVALRSAPEGLETPVPAQGPGVTAALLPDQVPAYC